MVEEEHVPGAKYTRVPHLTGLKGERVYIRTYYREDENGIARPISEYVSEYKVPKHQR